MGKGSILIVEDDGILAAHTEDVLLRMDYTVAGAVATGEQAVEAASERRPDLVLMDIELSGAINGIEAARRIRERHDVPVVYLTGYSQAPVLGEAKLTGPYAYLVKPVTEAELAACIEVSLHRHALDRQMRESRASAERSEARFRSLFENMAEGVALHELVFDEAGRAVDYRVLAVNPAFERETGLAPAECVGRLASEIYRAGEAPYLEIYEKVARSGAPVRFESYFAPLDRHFSVSAVCTQPNCFATVFADVSEQKRMQLALERERKKYRSLFESLADAAFVRELDGRLADVNQAACERLGYTREELLATPLETLYDAYTGDDLAAWVETVKRVGVCATEATQIARDGRRIPVEMRSRIVDYEGREALLGVARDITERKRAETALRVHEAFLREVLDSLPQRLAVVDAEGQVLSVNGPWRASARERGAGVLAQVDCGTNYLDVCRAALGHDPDGSVAAALEGIRSVLDGRLERFRMEYPCHSGDERRWFEMLVTPLGGARRGAVIAHSSITERKLAEAAARKVAEELDRYFHTALDLFCIAGHDGRFRRVNGQWTRALGYPTEELLRMRVFDLVHPEDAAAVEAAFSGGGEAARSLTNRVLCRDGSVRWLEWRAASRGELVFAAARDVTDRRRAEEDLERSRAELSAIYENAPVIMCLLDRDLRVMYANRAMQELAGTADVVGRLPGVLFGCVWAAPDQGGCGSGRGCGACQVRAAIERSLAERAPQANVECRIATSGPEGPKERVMLAAVAPIEEGERVRILLCLSDITERKRAEDVVRQSEENYRNLIDRLPDGVLVNADSRILFLNRAGARLLGCADGAAVVGMPVDLFIHPDSLPLALERRRAMADGAESVPSAEFRFVRQDGQTIDVEVASAVVTFQGRLAAHSVFRDISERKRLERQLLHAQKMESIGRLAGGVAHDFNNLLTVINGYSQMLIETMPAADPMRSTLEEIRKAGERAAGLTRQLLAFGRKQVLKPRRIDLNEVLRGMTSLLQRLTGEGVRLAIELASEAVLVNADPHQVEQVIMNLTINARHATADGGVVRVSTQAGASGPGGKRYGALSVTDSGVGMDAETRKHIFEPFFTTKGPAKGTGLGLPVVQGIVEQSGGWIDVISAPGEGSTFRVCLPSAEGGPVEEKAPAQAQPVCGGETILLVEDQADVREYAAAALEFHGYRVLRADGARQALQLWGEQSSRIDLVLTDVVMPEVSGPELAGRLRTLKPDVRILFMSGYADTQLARHGLEQSGGVLLEKPFTPPELASRVRSMLGQ